MAVFTEVGFDEAAALASRLGLGSLKALTPIKAGIENTNYFLSAERGEYVLTLFERLTFEQLPFFLHLMKHLAERGIPVPAPQVDAQGELLESELAFQHGVAASNADARLPRAAIHADLFRDNVMFADDAQGQPELTGFFDFYFAGVDRLAFDIAVCLNDWCIDLETGRLAEDRASAFVAAYESVRPLTGDELRLMPAMLRAAALRFWISRLWDVHLPRPASMLVPHDPGHFERVLRERIAAPWHPARG